VKDAKEATCEFTLGQNGPRLRLVVEEAGQAIPITPVRHDDDIFFLAPDSRLIAALVSMTANAL
jgi:hypothetical protein